jgi:hypothetical protein
MPDHPIIRWETEGGATLPADDDGSVPDRARRRPDETQAKKPGDGMRAEAQAPTQLRRGHGGGHAQPG